MARMKKRRYAGGGELEASDEIVVQGRRPQTDARFEDFNLRDYGGSGGFSGVDMAAMMGGGAGGGGRSSSQRITPISYEAPKSDRLAVVPAFLRGETSELSDLMGEKAPRGYGFKFRSDFAKGGKAKAKPVKKMAKGGKVSSASKRGDGCATKGKTKGRFV